VAALTFETDGFERDGRPGGWRGYPVGSLQGNARRDGQFEERPRGLRGERLGFETTARGFEGSVGSRRRGTALRARRSASARRGLRGWPTRSATFEVAVVARSRAFEVTVGAARAFEATASR
jgi:hypothetical protein